MYGSINRDSQSAAGGPNVVDLLRNWHMTYDSSQASSSQTGADNPPPTSAQYVQ